MKAAKTRILTVLAVGLSAAVLIGASIAEAQRAGRGGSLGSRGQRTQQQPAPTNTAPVPAQPMQRTTTQPGPAQVAPGARPAVPAAAAPARPSMGRSLMMGVGAGLLGAGIFGLLSGSGFFAGLGSLAGLFGFLLQGLLIGGLIWLAIRFFRSRQAAPQPAMAGVQRTAREPVVTPDYARQAAVAPSAVAAPVIEERDYNAFQQALVGVQQACGRGDVGALRLGSTPEMASYLEEEVAGYRERNHDFRVGEVKLLQGDLSEAWTERDAIYATVAMRYSIVSATMDRATGRVIEGDAVKPQEVTELWTFRAEHGPVRNWKLSAIQQVGEA